MKGHKLFLWNLYSAIWWIEAVNQDRKGQTGVGRADGGLTLESSRSMLSRLLLRWMRPLMRRSDGFPWLTGRERVEEAEIAIAPAPPVAPVGSSAPEGDASPSWGVTLQHQRWRSLSEIIKPLKTQAEKRLSGLVEGMWAHANVFVNGVTSAKLQICMSLSFQSERRDNASAIRWACLNPSICLMRFGLQFQQVDASASIKYHKIQMGRISQKSNSRVGLAGIAACLRGDTKMPRGSEWHNFPPALFTF